MKTITQYREDIKNLMKKVSDIDAQCVNESREPTEDEILLKGEMMDAVVRLKDVVDSMERQERIQKSLEGPQNRPATMPKGDKEKGHNIDMTDSRSKDKFKSFGEQLSAVINAARPNGSVDPRLFNAASGLNETVPSEGGFLVQQDFVSGLMEDTFQTGILSSRCSRQMISGNSNGMTINGVDETSRVSSRYGGILAGWGDEASTVAANKPKFREIELKLKDLKGFVYATRDLLSDAPGLESFIRQAVPGEFGFQLDDAIVNGNGAGKPLGYMNSGCLVTVDAENGQAPATLLPQNIVKMFSRRFAPQTQNYIWLYNQTIEPQLFTMTLDSGTAGVPIYMPPGGLSAAPYATILGRPAFAIEQAQALGTSGDIALVNLLNGYVLAEKGGIQSDVSIHVRFLYDESIFRFILRVDGQPRRATALTPYKGGASATQSHFIVMADRT